MTPLSDVFMLHIDAELDFALLKKIVESGHSRKCLLLFVLPLSLVSYFQ